MRESGDFNPFEMLMSRLYGKFPDPTAASITEVLEFVREFLNQEDFNQE
jgi:hypothetical protein